MADYRLTLSPDIVIRTADGAAIPNSMDNADWRVYQEWLGAGNTPDPAPGPTAEETRENALLGDTDRQAIINAIRTATPTQIKNYVNNNVTDLASARQMLMRILLLVAMVVRR